MIGYICSAITDFVVTFADDSDIVNTSWLVTREVFPYELGEILKVAVVVVGIAAVCTFLLSKPISAYQLGEAYAQSMGVNIKVFRVVIILLSSILSACVTAFAGPISFRGNCSSISYEKSVRNIKTDCGDTRYIFYRGCILYDL